MEHLSQLGGQNGIQSQPPDRGGTAIPSRSLPDRRMSQLGDHSTDGRCPGGRPPDEVRQASPTAADTTQSGTRNAGSDRPFLPVNSNGLDGPDPEQIRTQSVTVVCGSAQQRSFTQSANLPTGSNQRILAGGLPDRYRTMRMSWHELSVAERTLPPFNSSLPGYSAKKQMRFNYRFSEEWLAFVEEQTPKPSSGETVTGGESTSTTVMLQPGPLSASQSKPFNTSQFGPVGSAQSGPQTTQSIPRTTTQLDILPEKRIELQLRHAQAMTAGRVVPSQPKGLKALQEFIGSPEVVATTTANHSTPMEVGPVSVSQQFGTTHPTAGTQQNQAGAQSVPFLQYVRNQQSARPATAAIQTVQTSTSAVPLRNAPTVPTSQTIPARNVHILSSIPKTSVQPLFQQTLQQLPSTLPAGLPSSNKTLGTVTPTDLIKPFVNRQDQKLSANRQVIQSTRHALSHYRDAARESSCSRRKSVFKQPLESYLQRRDVCGADESKRLFKSLARCNRRDPTGVETWGPDYLIDSAKLFRDYDMQKQLKAETRATAKYANESSSWCVGMRSHDPNDVTVFPSSDPAQMLSEQLLLSTTFSLDLSDFSRFKRSVQTSNFKTNEATTHRNSLMKRGEAILKSHIEDCSRNRGKEEKTPTLFTVFGNIIESGPDLRKPTRKPTPLRPDRTSQLWTLSLPTRSAEESETAVRILASNISMAKEKWKQCRRALSDSTVVNDGNDVVMQSGKTAQGAISVTHAPSAAASASRRRKTSRPEVQQEQSSRPCQRRPASRPPTFQQRVKMLRESCARPPRRCGCAERKRIQS